MRVLGVTAGASPRGSADVLLTEALRSASVSGADVAMVRVDDLDLSVGPSARGDDAQWFWDQLMAADGLIVSTPIYSRTVPGKLRLLGDKISGPQADVAFTAELLERRASGAPIAVDFAVDERVLHPRVAGFIAVGGSIPARWKTLTLPTLHTLTASAQIAVVDQVQFAGAGGPGSIVLDEAALTRAAALGRTVAEQCGLAFDDTTYRGEPGLCPMCHLNVFVLSGDSVECATCGASGRLVMDDAAPRLVFDASGRAASILTMGEKQDHFREVQETAAQLIGRAAEVAAGVGRYDGLDWTVRPPRPSNTPSS